jgi:hypothetical protein
VTQGNIYALIFLLEFYRNTMFSPVALLTLLCCTTIVLFGDRGAVSSNSITGDKDSGIRQDFGITVAETGWVYAAGMVRNYFQG